MKRHMYVFMILWTTLIALSLAWTLRNAERDRTSLARVAARSFFKQIVLSRAWNASHGGVYVPVTENCQPNQYLIDQNRDVTTVDGLQLTKINPAFMTRQISEIAEEINGISFHITSLNPLRPANEPTAWERNWLESFEQGITEKSGFVDGEKASFRYMAPLMVNEGCLKCHAVQGYKKGDIRGESV